MRKHLVAGDRWNVRTVAAELEVSAKTIYRDIEFMQNFLGYQFRFDQRTKSYFGKAPAPVL